MGLYLCYTCQVIRGGRRIEVSIFDIVVGDVVALKIGDQVRLCKSMHSDLIYVLCCLYF
jgi:hypothetical protein